MPRDILLGLAEDVTAGVRAWDSGDPQPARADDVDVFVPPYTATAADLQLLGRLPGLRLVQTLTAGVDNVVDLVPEGVTLCNAAGVHDASTAELAVALTLASLRHVDGFARAMPRGQWCYARHESLADKRVLIVGFGGIGTAIARRLAGFECDVVAVARSSRTTQAVAVAANADLPDLLPDADVVILAVPLSESTRGLVDASFLAAMSDGALLVNVSRGAVVDSDCLLAECSTGRIRAALDVTDPEPLPPGHPLWRTPGVLISPHVGGNTSAFLPRARALVSHQLRRYRDGEPLANVVQSGSPRP